MNLVLVRNPHLEALIAESKRATPFSPRYDVEELDNDRIPVRVHGLGLTAERAKALVARLQARRLSPPDDDHRATTSRHLAQW